MLTKFESKSNRVKGLSFHVNRPWILTSLHNGVIQLWDYRMGVLLHRFDEHDGPVRGVHFHVNQPLFVSGGDDYKLKIWDYKLKRCLFTLLGHLDYIRTVNFHPEYPWIVSASDDQTIRIWNWQSRSCVSVLTGHNHYVMCASFHPKEDLVVSASLDQTVRVWDTTGLRKKNVRAGPPSTPNPSSRSGNSGELFGGNDAIVKYVLEGHDRGVNYASFHPTLPLIVSSADDRQVKLWRMNETKAWEVDTMRGHTNNVSSVLFHPKHELIISNSEDRSIRVWDISKRIGVQTFRRESDRFWILAAHPTQNLLAAGHDSGMIVFKLERERPAMEVHSSTVFYVKERYLRMHELASGRDLPVVSLRRTGTLGTGLGNLPKTLNVNAYNPSENNVLLLSGSDGGTYELFCFPKDGGGGQTTESSDSKRGNALAAVFCARNRFAVLDKSRSLMIKNFDNEVTKKITLPNGRMADGLFFGGTIGRILLRVAENDKMMLYETQSRRILNEITAPRVKYIYWNDNFDMVALVSKHGITLCDKQLTICCHTSETVRIKSGIWDAQNLGIFIYTTLNHIKYILPNGDFGILKSLDVPVYLTMVDNTISNDTHMSTLHVLDREGKMKHFDIDLTECLFKMALDAKSYGKVMHMVKHSRLCGKAIISYLTEKGYPEVALHFVQDDITRFNLAISCGNLEVALNCAYELDNSECWTKLGVEALRQGNLQITEMTYQRTKDFERLSFLYLITGNRLKLKKMMKIAEMRGDVMGQFHTALYLGDVNERVKILESVGQLPLAYLTAKAHGLSPEMDRLVEKMEGTPENEGDTPENKGVVEKLNTVFDDFSKPTLMLPPVPIMVDLEDENWPLLSSTEPSLEEISKHQDELNKNSKNVSEQRMSNNDEFDDFDTTPAKNNMKKQRNASEEIGEEWDDDLDLGEELVAADDLMDELTLEDNDSTFVAAPMAGSSLPSQWISNSSVAGDHIAAGSFDSAMKLLNRQIGIVNFAPLKPIFLKIYTGSCMVMPTSSVGLASLPVYLQRNGANLLSFPKTCLEMSQLSELLKVAYKCFTTANFDLAKSNFELILHSIPCLVLTESEEIVQVKELVNICREYLLAIALRNQVGLEALDVNPCRNVELNAYLSHCNLRPSHTLLTLKSAMSNAYKSKNYIAAATFCRRLLEFPDITSERNAKLRMTAKKVLQKSETEARNEHALDYDENKSFKVCGGSLTPIYGGMEQTKCPFCATAYKMDFKGSICTICLLSRVGEQTIGLVVSGNML